MTDVQEKLLELLIDLDDICQRNNIKYYLCSETVLGAFTKKAFLSSCCEANVAMTPDHALKFIHAVKAENRSDRITDSMYSNKNYPDFTVRFGNPNTLMMKLPYQEAGTLPCIAVTIHMIRYKPRHFKKLYKYTKAFWTGCTKPTYMVTNPTKRFVSAVCHGIKNVFGGTHFSRWLFKRWCSMFTSNRKSSKISICAGKYTYEPELLVADEKVELEGKMLNTFGYVDAYIKAKYGSNYKKAAPKYLKASSSLLVSTQTPYQAFLNRAAERNVDFRAIHLNKIDYTARQKKVKKYNAIINTYYAIVDRTDRRFAMYEMYMPIKDQLVQLHDEERYAELNELLKPYRGALWDCYKKGLGLCFDKDIFEMTMDILEREGSYTYVKKLRARVPAHHWEPMTITNYKGEPEA